MGEEAREALEAIDKVIDSLFTLAKQGNREAARGCCWSRSCVRTRSIRTRCSTRTATSDGPPPTELYVLVGLVSADASSTTHRGS